MKIEINADQVDQLVRDTILKAGIGKTIEGAVQKILGAHSYNNPVEDELKKYIASVVRLMLETDFKDQVNAAVRAVLEKKVTQPIMEKMADAAIDKIVRAAEDKY